MRQPKRPLEDWFYIMSIAAVLLGGICFVTYTNFQGTANADDIKEIKIKADAAQKEFEEIRVRLTHIEDALGVKR